MASKSPEELKENFPQTWKTYYQLGLVEGKKRGYAEREAQYFSGKLFAPAFVNYCTRMDERFVEVFSSPESWGRENEMRRLLETSQSAQQIIDKLSSMPRGEVEKWEYVDSHRGDEFAVLSARSEEPETSNE